MRVAIIDDDGTIAASWPIDPDIVHGGFTMCDNVANCIECFLPIDWDRLETEGAE